MPESRIVDNRCPGPMSGIDVRDQCPPLHSVGLSGLSPNGDSIRRSHVLRTLRKWFRDHDRRTDLWRAPDARAGALDAVGAIILLGVGILSGVMATRQKD